MGGAGSTLTPEAKMAGFPLSSMSSSSSLVVVLPAASRGHTERSPPEGVQQHPSAAAHPSAPALPPHSLISSCLWMRPLQRSR